jgi:hypothetical protein
MGDTDKVVTIFQSTCPRFVACGAVVECQIGNVMNAFQLLEHVIRAYLAAFINRMKQFGFEPQDTHKSWSQVSGLRSQVQRTRNVITPDL